MRSAPRVCENMVMIGFMVKEAELQPPTEGSRNRIFELRSGRLRLYLEGCRRLVETRQTEGQQRRVVGSIDNLGRRQ